MISGYFLAINIHLQHFLIFMILVSINSFEYFLTHVTNFIGGKSIVYLTLTWRKKLQVRHNARDCSYLLTGTSHPLQHQLLSNNCSNVLISLYIRGSNHCCRSDLQWCGFCLFLCVDSTLHIVTAMIVVKHR